MDMRKVTFLKLLVGVAAFSGVGLLFAGNAQYITESTGKLPPEQKEEQLDVDSKVSAADLPTLKKAKFTAEDIEKGTLGVTRKDVDVSLQGRVRQDWIGYEKIYTLRASNADQLSAFRTKACVDFVASYGKQRFGKSAADAMLRLTNYGYWKAESYYMPFVEVADPTASPQTKAINLLTYVEEAWVNLHFGTFFEAYDNWFSYKKHPVSLKVGYFPYTLGRGISLGDYPMHIPYLGWQSYNYDDTRSNHPGILIHGYINKDISYDLYYSKRQELSISRSLTWKTVHDRRTDRTYKFRGIAKDRELWAASMDFNHDKRWGKLHVQPYLLYVDSPELQIEFEADSSARLGTVGMMTKYQKGRFTMNVEVAGQFGHQNVYAIDRNEQVVETDLDGRQILRHTHVFYGDNAATSENMAPVNGGALVANVNSFANRGGICPDTGNKTPSVTKNGDLLQGGSVYVLPYADSGSLNSHDIYNSNVTGNARFRNNYRLDYRGFMGAVDMKYEFEKVPVIIAATATYISGDKYPFNSECGCSKRYKAFLPYGDYDYIGKYVYSQVVLDARKLPRPTDISYRHGYAFNNVKDTSNLAFLGLGTTWHPFEDKNKLMFRTNLLWFWQTATLKKWNKACPLPYDGGRESYLFQGDKTWTHDSIGIWSTGSSGICGKDYYRKGWKSCDDASRMLGTELNFEVQYRPVRNCIFLAQLGCFIPGDLYKDLDGQPNERTKDGPQAASGVYGLGHDPVWRGALSLDYRF